MQKITDSNKGTYLLEFYSPSSFKIELEKFIHINFPKGYYYYSGSAQKNLSHRIKRHELKNKKLHWHIDYLSSHEKIKLVRVYIFNNAEKSAECDLVAELTGKFKMKSAAKGFGNSDCRICDSHLLYSKTKLNQSHFISRYQSAVSFIP